MPRITVDPLVKGNVVSHQHTDPLLVTNADVSGTPGTPSLIQTGDPNTKGLIIRGNTTSSYPLTATTSAYYKFDENTGSSVSDSALTNTGTWQGTLGSQWTTGIVNSGGNFNGSDNYVDIGAATFLDGVNKAWFSLWFYTTGLNANKTLIGRWNYQTQGQFAIQLDASTATNIRVFVAESVGEAGSNYMQALDANFLANNWYHVVVAYDGTLTNSDRIKIYRNSTLCTTQVGGTIRTSFTSPTANLRIGDFQGLNRYWLGKIDEVAIGTGTITQSDVTALYNAGAGNQYGGIVQVSNLMEIQNAQSIVLGSVNATGIFTVPGMGIGGAPGANAVLDVASTTKAFLPPRMTTTQRDAIGSPLAGMMVYNTTTAKLNVYTTAWEEITSA